MFGIVLLCVAGAGGPSLAATPGRQLQMTAPAGFMPGVPILVRLDLLGPEGQPEWAQWDATVSLTTEPGTVTVTPSQILLRNGSGSALVTIAGGDSFTLTAQWDGLESSRLIASRAGDSGLTVSGVLPGTETTWSGLVRVLGDVTVPEGHTLTIASNTLVLIDGVSSGTTAPDILVSGRLESLGTQEYPVLITCSDPARNWGQIRHNNAQPSLYRHTLISKGGRAPGEGHTGTGPVIRLSGSSIRLEECVISDLTDVGGNTIGKIMQSSSGSEVTFLGCQAARSRMGPELSATAVYCENTYFMDMRGPDDDDAIYIHTQSAGQLAMLNHCVVYGTDDDGIDTLGSLVTVTNCLIRDVFDKGTSVFNNEVQIWRSLYVDCGIGISTKTGNDQTVRTRIDHCTVLGRDRGIAAENKGGGSPTATVLYYVTNSIIGATGTPANSVYTDYDPNNISIFYSDILGETWPGTGNVMVDPQFVDAGNHDFQLQPGSPGIDAGDPAFPSDPDGSRTDLGCFPFAPPAPYLEQPQMIGGGEFEFLLFGFTNRSYHVEFSTNLQHWDPLTSVPMTQSPVSIQDLDAATGLRRFYRVRMGP